MYLIFDYVILTILLIVRQEEFSPGILAPKTQCRVPDGNFRQRLKTVMNKMVIITAAKHEYASAVAADREQQAVNFVLRNEYVLMWRPVTNF